MPEYAKIVRQMPCFEGLKILVVGDVMLDEYIETRVTRISPEAPVPVASVLGRRHVPGGAANVARNLARIGCRVTLVGLKGSDAAGASLVGLLHEEGIEDGLVIGSAERPTVRKCRITAQRQQLLRLDEEDGSDMSASEKDAVLAVFAAALPGCGAVILSDYAKGLFQVSASGECLTGVMIASCRERGIPVLIDPKGTGWERYEGADCITPNSAEFSEATGCDPDDLPGVEKEGEELLRRLRLKRLLITRSEKGMLLLGDGPRAASIAAVAREVADVSGAGDTVIAVLAACAAAGLAWRPAAEIANVAAGIVVGKSGTSPITKKELSRALEGRA